MSTKTKKLIKVKSLPHQIRLADIASPLVDMPHTHRVTLFREGKECGTTIPYMLFAALKASYLIESELDEEPTGRTLEKDVQSILRHVLHDIHKIALSVPDSKVMVGKTLQEKLFKHIAYGEPLMPVSQSDLVLNEKSNHSHTLSSSTMPSFTLPTFLCQWVFWKDGLNVDTPIVHANAYLKRVAAEVFGEIESLGDARIKKSGGFSRRVQNRLFLMAFERSDSTEILGVKLRNRFKK